MMGKINTAEAYGMDTYNLFSAYYDLTLGNFTDDLPFWSEMAKKHGGQVCLNGAIYRFSAMELAL